MRILVSAVSLVATTAVVYAAAVTPPSNDYTPVRSIGTVPPAERDFDPDARTAKLDEMALMDSPPLGAPGALGIYPRPMPSRGSTPPLVRLAVQKQKKQRQKQRQGGVSRDE